MYPDDVPPDLAHLYIQERETHMTNQQIQNIALHLIGPPVWDSRMSDPRKDPDWSEFVESMKPGQLQPIIIEGPFETSPTYVRVFGGRRYAAAEDLGWETIACIVRLPSDDTTRTIDNAVENLGRKNLTSYETARTFARLREVGLTGEVIGAKFGLSKQRVSNLVKPLANLPAPILEDWKNNVAAVDTNVLGELSRLKTDDEKVKAWEDRKTEIAKRTDVKTGKVKPKVKEPAAQGLPISQRNFKEVLDFVKSKACPAKLGGDKAWVVALMNYLCSQRSSPPEGIPVPVTSAGEVPSKGKGKGKK